MTIVEKIHAEIDSAQDRILNEANEILSSKNEKVLTQAERLRKIGFKKTPLAKEGEIQRSKKEVAEEIAERVTYYLRTYPFLKFITEEEMDRICEKWGLVYAPVSNYTKDVPEKNLQDIERAQELRPEDVADDRVILTLNKKDSWHTSPREIVDMLDKGIDITGKEFSQLSSDGILLRFLKKHGYYNGEYNDYIISIHGSAKIKRIDRSGLFIAAPVSHFNTDGLNKKDKGFFSSVLIQEVKDPIVFRYVRGGIQVITKWGEEANDPSLILPQDN